jgi:general secretion pathway protein D
MKLILLAFLVTIGWVGAQTSDAPGPSEFISEVIPIKYARAADVAAVLLRMTTNSVGASAAASSPSAVSSSNSPTTPAGGPNAGNDFSQRLQNVIRRASTSGEIQTSGQLPVIADERTNSLLIYATRQDMQRMKEAISRLDVALAQVLIEAVIFQIPARGSNTLGTSYPGAAKREPENYSFGTGALSSSNMLSTTRFDTAGATDTATSQPSGFAYLAKPGSDLDAMMSALAGDSRVRILQRPRIQTSDGESATIFVGETRPRGGSLGGAYSSIPSIEIVKTWGMFEVTPFIKPDGLVMMDIHQKIDRLVGTTNIANVGQVPVTSTTETRTKVTVRDHETILLGGLIETAKPHSPSGVPLLKGIPLLGPLFRSSSTRTERNEILVLIRPTVLPSSETIATPTKTASNQQAEARR